MSRSHSFCACHAAEVLVTEDGGQHLSISDAFIKGMYISESTSKSFSFTN